MKRRLIGLLLLALAAAAGRAHAAAPPWNTAAPYDLDNLGIPKFINTNFVDLLEVNQLSKFRSNAGHNYSDQLEFGNEAVIDPTTGKPETCSSMKHYFWGLDKGTPIYAPVAGTVASISPSPYGDVGINFQPDGYPAFGLEIFHVTLSTALNVGDHVAEGQLLGTFPGMPYIADDIAVFVKTTKGFHLISYFDVLTDAAFAPYQARGVSSRDQLIHTQAERDAAPFNCPGGSISFVNVPYVDPAGDYVSLTGGAVSQTISYSALPSLLHTSDQPFTITTSASSGQPVVLSTTTPAICTASGNTIVPLASGSCGIQISQAGIPDQLHAVTYNFYSTTVIAGLNASPIYASAQTGLESFLRFANTGTTAGTVTVTLFDLSSGQSLGKWTSPSIPAGAEQQYSIRTVEAAMTQSTANSQYYSILVQSGITGTFQHVLWRPSAGALSNLTTCPYGTGIDQSFLSGVHSSLVGRAGYPSAVIINNMGDAGTVALGIYDARNGHKLATYTTASIPTNGRLVVDIATVEAATNILPTADMNYYVVKVESTFTGFLQHLVTNTQPGVVTDMTTRCSLDASGSVGASGPTQTSLVYSSKDPTQQSYIRIANTSYNSGTTVTVTLNDPATGKALGTWTSPSIPSNTAQQFAVATMEQGLDPTAQKPAYYALSFASSFSGYMQHVVWNTAANTLTNLTTCSTGVLYKYLVQTPFVHSSLNPGYPSTVFLTSIDSTPSTWAFYYNDTITGRYAAGLYDIFNLLSLPSNGSKVFDVAATEAIGNNKTFKPAAGEYYFTAAATMETPLTVVGTAGYMQNLVTSVQTGVVDNMTTVCPLQ